MDPRPGSRGAGRGSGESGEGRDSGGGFREKGGRAGIREAGFGLLITPSRSLARAEDPGREARKLRQAINAVRARPPHDPPAELRGPNADLADGLLEAGCVRFGSFTLKSGAAS